MANQMMTMEEANAAANNTRDAFSHDRYGANEWTACALVLGLSGFSQADAEQILRSKIMRWAADQEAPTASAMLNWITENGTDSVLAA